MVHGAVCLGAGRGELLGRLRAAGRYVERYLRGIWLGARCRPQLGRGPGLPRHHYGHHRYLCRAGAYARRRSVPDYDDLAGHQWRAAACSLGIPGGYRGRPSHYGCQPQRSRVEHAHLGDYRRDYGAHGRHVCPASDGLQRLTPTFASEQAAAMGRGLFFVCYRVLVI